MTERLIELETLRELVAAWTELEPLLAPHDVDSAGRYAIDLEREATAAERMRAAMMQIPWTMRAPE